MGGLRREVGARALGHAGPVRFGWSNTFRPDLLGPAARRHPTQDRLSRKKWIAAADARDEANTTAA